ncbi:hypothetical protein [Haloechinothrix halophila]|uniref:hypothetical protein n=1 Tax=Haloechinothrix halophila TaxID=1069073 RepID=UPI000403F449|nr:hypothetical protein [Haloechinothrix halophila]
MTTPASTHDAGPPLRFLQLGYVRKLRARGVPAYVIAHEGVLILTTPLVGSEELIDLRHSRTPVEIGASGVDPGPAADMPPAGEPAPTAPGRAA